MALVSAAYCTRAKLLYTCISAVLRHSCCWLLIDGFIVLVAVCLHCDKRRLLLLGSACMKALLIVPVLTV